MSVVVVVLLLLLLLLLLLVLFLLVVATAAVVVAVVVFAVVAVAPYLVYRSITGRCERAVFFRGPVARPVSSRALLSSVRSRWSVRTCA